MRTTTHLPPPAEGHYENFPVASWLCPAALRPAVAAVYWFARTADDIADEGTALTHQRLAELDHFEADLLACASGAAVSERWPQVFTPLASAMAGHGIALAPLQDLLSAFRQDVVRTHSGVVYADREELVAYCQRSANPIGRIMLGLYGIDDPRALAHGDAVCTALQLINFWQDLSVDMPRGRFYVPAQDCRAHGLDPAQPASWDAHPHAPAMVASLADWARSLMNAGAPVCGHVPGRGGWELRAVVQGGLRILDRIEHLGFDTFARRPRIGLADAPVIVWRCLRMPAGRSAAV